MLPQSVKRRAGPRLLRRLRDEAAARVPWRVRQRLSAVTESARDRALGLVTPRIPLPPSVAHKTVVLVGASVGRDWRLHLPFPGAVTLDIYQFDKTEMVAEALRRGPDLVILKECAAYFPRDDPEASQALVRGWVEQVRAAGVAVALATVVPVTRDHAHAEPGRAEGLWAFNDWVRAHAADEGLAVLDLEAAVRCSAADRHLDDALHSGDGLHLSRRTYREHLDALIPPLLLRVFTP